MTCLVTSPSAVSCLKDSRIRWWFCDYQPAALESIPATRARHNAGNVPPRPTPKGVSHSLGWWAATERPKLWLTPFCRCARSEVQRTASGAPSACLRSNMRAQNGVAWTQWFGSLLIVVLLLR